MRQCAVAPCRSPLALAAAALRLRAAAAAMAARLLLLPRRLFCDPSMPQPRALLAIAVTTAAARLSAAAAPHLFVATSAVAGPRPPPLVDLPCALPSVARRRLRLLYLCVAVFNDVLMVV
ncbi:hypothetical protein Syun_025926 [Stephania yunnanensis]|uniref:Uncharacterized protein n=1 Tax=Stephania yunnanensis TaxID=152371 RepID=A0AAP0HW79_9MAGN